jgi:hypothetical protein
MKPKLLIAVAAVCVVCLTAVGALLVLAQSGRVEQERVVLGTELLKAEEAEKRRKASGVAGVSPMPPGKYEFSGEELGLVNPKPNALDSAITELCRRYAQSDAATRERMRRSIDADDLYTLQTFADRAAVFALRERSAARLADGLTAIALIETERVDFRDLYTSVGLLHYTAVRIRADHRKLFGGAAALAEPRTAEIIRAGL